ncbi:hypothetical protein EI42_01511 [Thermosporothrix hazakensis]|jgi:hypothetical protein|uniref:Uncharacterized protein n=2 Tax=Thermosporothrix TaxID=768650 RepID=A0A326U9S5_THEHA|nr:hypothetical protein [Thermosporothrix hazakensis]PZW32966.1 hypothetical protein EI42_01511 [Thermosporothrix hazakensis]BBH90948.1 hypothetical protein KTC_56990 [Thermosporothrix sp. COM3]GCE48998.1 hypothetical protein KTH_38670 [Thermosporothrix hazakensis]
MKNQEREPYKQYDTEREDQEEYEQERKKMNRLDEVTPQNDPHLFGASEDAADYSFRGPHGEYAEEKAPDQYGPQDQFGDVDNQDPYSNLDQEDTLAEEEEPSTDPRGEDPTRTPTGEEPYGLDEPLAKPGQRSNVGRDRDKYGTKGFQDQYDGSF